MSLSRFYPTPSDRMGIIWSLLPIEDSVVLEYGPAGTTHFGGGYYGSFGMRLSGSLFTTHISEDDVIMGDVSRLEKAIVEIDQTYHPKTIFVVASAVIAVIGTDIKGVCQYMQDRVKARLITFEDGGFRGDYTYGLRAVYKLIAKEISTKERNVEINSYQILGASAGSYRIRSDIWELKSLMTEAFCWNCRLVIGLESSMEQLETAGNSQLNLVIRDEAIEAAEILREKYETDYVCGIPYGYTGTLNWLTDISKAIGIPINPKLEARLKEKIMDMIPMGGGPMTMAPRKPARATVMGDYDTILSIAAALDEMGISAENLICTHSLKAIDNPDERVKYYSKEKDKLELCRSLHGHWILGDNVMPKYCPEDNYFTCISSPFSGKPQIASHLPFAGERGMDYLMELKAEYFNKFGM